MDNAGNSTPWDEVGKVVMATTAAEAMTQAELDWQVDFDNLKTISFGIGIEDTLAIVAKNKVLGIVGERYTPVQNVDAFKFFDFLVSEGKAVYCKAGSLDDGKKVWLLAKLEGVLNIGDNDQLTKYVLLSNAHDGTSKRRALFIPSRNLCANMLTIVSGGDVYAVKHTDKAANQEPEDVGRHVLGKAEMFFSSFTSLASRLVGTAYNEKQMVALADHLFPNKTNDIATRTKNIREKLLNLFNHGKGHENIQNTAWAAINAVTEFVDHVRTTRIKDGSNKSEKESKLASLWFGSGALLKRKAFEIITRQVNL